MEYLRAAHGEGRHGLIMPGGADGTHGQSYTKKVISKAGEKLGLVGLHPHALRATFATAHWEAGTTLNQLTAMLGHKDPNTTMGYIRQRPLSAAVAQAKVAAAMNLVSSPPLVPAGKADAQKRAKK
jgi:integrase